MVRDNIRKLRQEISSICQRIDRKPEEITLVAITKNASVVHIQEAIDNGITHIGENRIQEAQKKFPFSRDYSAIKFHLVGHLQTNKIRSALEIFNLIQSVDSLHLARQIEVLAAKLAQEVAVLIQVNVSGEKTKFGIKPEELAEFLEAIGKLKYLRIKGLMTIAPLSENPEDSRPYFRNLRLLKEKTERQIRLPNVNMQYLSMGMTNDYQIAIEEGANMLRIGRAIFETADEHRLKDTD